MSQVVFIIQHPGHDPREREDEDEKKKQEQEAKLKKLLKENEELQKDIAEVDNDDSHRKISNMFCPLQKDRKIDLLRKHIAAKREAAAAAARAKEEEESRRLEAASGAANGNLRSDNNWVVNVTDAVRGGGEEIVRGESRVRGRV